ncbi:hypothetical protein BH09VER1_BH09VER1_38560 [soil metagenome]
MDSEQAKIILSAHRPGRDDVESDALLSEALAAMENDPVLAAWFAEQQAMDAGMRAAVRSIQIPSHLRESILAQSKTLAFPTHRTSWASPIWLAAAALVVIGIVAGLFLPRDKRPSFAVLESEIPQLTAAHQHPFEGKSADIDKIRAWFASNGAPSDFSMPGSLKAAQGMGCEVVSVEGAKVSLMCFKAGDSYAHLYVVDRSQFSQAPAVGTEPHMQQAGEYAMASWSEGNLTYVLAARGSVDSVKRLL